MKLLAISYEPKNYYHLYTEDIDMFGDNFGDSLEEYVKKCAHDQDSSPYCLNKNKDLIENVFNGLINFQELEIVLITIPKEIKLLPISKFMNVNISTISLQSLSIQEVVNIYITSEIIAVNDYWQFVGNRKTLILKLEANSTLFIDDQITEPVTLQLTNVESSINLLNCDEQRVSKITILKYGSNTNKLTIYGSYEIANNFIHSHIADTIKNEFKSGNLKLLEIINSYRFYIITDIRDINIYNNLL